MTYDGYSFLDVKRRADGVVLITMNRPEVLNACDESGHDELGRIWLDVERDPKAKLAVITGAGKAFSSGGDLRSARMGDPETAQETMRHGLAIVHNMINSTKPVVSAINGVAVGAGLAVALLADVSIASDRARIIDGHTKLGVVAGDHAALVWPLLCGMARAKYYLLLCEEISGPEAAEIGLVSRCVPHDELMATTLEIAERLAAGSQLAIRGTKQVLNNWFKSNIAIFDQSMSSEMLTFFLPDVTEGMSAFLERRSPQFPSAHVPAGDDA